MIKEIGKIKTSKLFHGGTSQGQNLAGNGLHENLL